LLASDYVWFSIADRHSLTIPHPPPSPSSSQHAAGRFASNVELVALLEATNIMVLLTVLAVMGQLSDLVTGLGDNHLMQLGVGSAVLKVGSSLVYQRALQLSPMSLSVPYLAFTPMLLLVTSYFLLGEVPSVGNGTS
jgi:uncharacterized membrane protein